MVDDRPTLDQCRCPMRTRLLGDGCEHCNPELARELRADRQSAALAETRAQLEEERARNAATWLPMNTAPHDGTIVLVILPVWNVPHAAAFERGYWHEQFSGQPLAGKAAPTHWRPLPAPPLAIIPGDAI